VVFRFIETPGNFNRRERFTTCSGPPTVGYPFAAPSDVVIMAAIAALLGTRPHDMTLPGRQ
jgi:hypothetical protein